MRSDGRVYLLTCRATRIVDRHIVRDRSASLEGHLLEWVGAGRVSLTAFVRQAVNAYAHQRALVVPSLGDLILHPGPTSRLCTDQHYDGGFVEHLLVNPILNR